MQTVTSEATDLGGTLLTVYEDGVMVACLEYFWIKHMEDINRLGRGEQPEPGAVLYVTNIATATPGTHTLETLKHRLPPHRYIAGLRLLTPRGVPDDWYAQASVPVSV